MTATCPAGHTSAATDYCDTCGLAIRSAPDDTGLLPVTPVATGPGSGDCPSCGTTNPANALFCESCGYDFTTGAMPRPPEPVAAPTPVPTPPSDVPPPVATVTHVAEVWIDPDWYADQGSTDPLPSPGVPVVVPLRHTSNLVGRTSRSRDIHPEIDLGTDPGISRRHAQLTTDGMRWWVEDLGSSNGTYVGGALGVLPKAPVPQGQKTEVRPDERVYLGAWTRIVIRKAAPGEI